MYVFSCQLTGGLLTKWQNDAVWKLKRFKTIERSSKGVEEQTKESCSLDSYVSCFFMYFLGNFVALVCLVVEIYFDHLQQNGYFTRPRPFVN